MMRTEKNVTLFEKCNRILSDSGFGAFQMRCVGGGSDASNLTALGIPCLDSLGVYGGKIHSKDEYASLASLPLVAKQLAAIACALDA
jgi:glutamate carboxypeptidase